MFSYQTLNLNTNSRQLGGKERKGGREGKRKEKKKTPCWEDIFAVVKIE